MIGRRSVYRGCQPSSLRSFSAEATSAGGRRRARVNQLAILDVFSNGGQIRIHTVPGLTFHREMETLVSVRIAPEAVLQAATTMAAKVLRQDKLLGTI